MIAIGILAIAIVHLAALPMTFWRAGEVLAGRALLTYEPLAHQPAAGTGPLYVGVGRVLNALAGDPFHALVALNFIAALAAFVGFAIAFGEIVDDGVVGACASFALLMSPAVLIESTGISPEFVALAFVGAAGLAAVRALRAAGDGARAATATGAFAAAAVACAPILAPAAAATMIVFVAFGLRGAAQRASALGATAMTSLMCWYPLVEAVSPRELGRFIAASLRESRIASSAAAVSFKDAALRFTAHIWGPKVLSFPLLLIAAAGLFFLVTRRSRASLFLVLLAALHTAWCIGFATRAEGVTPALPGAAGVLLLVAAAFAFVPLIPRRAAATVFAIAFAVASWWYAGPVVRQRTGKAAPAMAAREYADRHVPPGARVFHEPFLDAFLRDFGGDREVLPLSEIDRSAPADMPMFTIVNGRSNARGAATFEWADSDAYGKLTTAAYRVVSVIPVPPSERYVAVSGVYGLERTDDGHEWRWLAPKAAIEVPPGGPGVRVTVGLPADAPEGNELTIRAERTSARIVLAPGETKAAMLPVTAAAPARLTFEAARRLPGKAHDQRELAAQLVRIERR